MPDSITPADMVGSTGVALLLGAFALNLVGRLERTSVGYMTLNAVGAGLAALASWMIGYMPFVVLEGTWCIVSIVAIGVWVRNVNLT